jgi:RNA polymerase sigma-70 factor (ECF subfamily)
MMTATPPRKDVTGLISGCRSSFERLYMCYRDRVYFYVLKMTKSEELAKEIVQDVFVKVWINREKVDPAYNFSSFVFKVARNHSINVLKRLTYEKMAKERIAKSSVSHITNTEDKVVFNEYMDIMDKAVGELPPRRKSIFEMSRNKGISHDEIAGIMGISKNTVKSQLVKATKSIKNYFALNADMTLQ